MNIECGPNELILWGSASQDANKRINDLEYK